MLFPRERLPGGWPFSFCSTTFKRVLCYILSNFLQCKFRIFQFIYMNNKGYEVSMAQFDFSRLMFNPSDRLFLIKFSKLEQIFKNLFRHKIWGHRLLVSTFFPYRKSVHLFISSFMPFFLSFLEL